MSISYNEPPEDNFDDLDNEIPPDDVENDDPDGLEGENGEQNTDPSLQDPTKQAKASGDPKTPKPTEQAKLTPQEIEAKVAEYQAQLEALKPYQELNDRIGGYEGIQPAVEFFDMLHSPEFNPQEALNLIGIVNPEALPAMAWHIIDAERDTLVNDPSIRQAVLGSDPDYQKFLKWQETGEIPQDQPVDAKTKELQDRLDKIEKEKAESAAQQTKLAEENKRKATDAHVTKYDNERLKSVDAQIAKLNWGDEHKELGQSVRETALASFNSDPAARQALDYARRLSLQSASNPKDQKLKTLLNNATKRVENIFTQKLNKIIAPINKAIQGNNSATQAKLAAQKSKPVLGNNGGTISQADALSGLSGYDRAKARWNATGSAYQEA